MSSLLFLLLLLLKMWKWVWASPSGLPAACPSDDGDVAISEPPNPDWKPGEGLSKNSARAREWREGMDREGWYSVDPSSLNLMQNYHLMVSGMIPRPIAFVSSVSAAGVPNLAVYSYFTIISHIPPLVSITCIRSTRMKDTCANILDTKEYTISVVSEPFVEAAHWTSTDAPGDIDEWIGSGLTKAPSIDVKPPRVREAAYAMECELYQSHDFTHPKAPDMVTSTLLIGLVKRIHVRNDVLTREDAPAEYGDVYFADPTKLQAVAKLGGDLYTRVFDAFRLPSKAWKDVRQEPDVGRIYALEKEN